MQQREGKEPVTCRTLGQVRGARLRDPIDAHRDRASGAEAGKRGNGDVAPASGHEIASEGMEVL